MKFKIGQRVRIVCPKCGEDTYFRFHNGDPDQGAQEVCECGWEGEPA